MAGSTLCFGISFAIICTTVGGTVYASSRDTYDMMTAVVVFNSTDLETNLSERLGSTDPNDEIGKYGRTSPKQSVSGLVQLPAKNAHYGCSNPYQGVDTTVPWIALIERGDCSFAQKIKEARLANASGVIIYDENSIVMDHEGEEEIVAVSIPQDVGESVVSRITDGKVVTVTITRGHPYVTPYGRGNRTSIIFVSLSFLILMIISLTWLIVYYVQRFRLVHTPDILKKRRAQARKIISSLPKKLLKEGDKELTSEEICPICIETYKVEETLRILPCKHIFHRKCVDPWLRLRDTCPMCKLDVMKSRGLMPSPYDPNFIFGTRTPIVEVWEPDTAENGAGSSNSSYSLVDSLEYRESIIVAEVEEESTRVFPASARRNGTSSPVSSSSEETPSALQSTDLSCPDTLPGEVAPP